MQTTRSAAVITGDRLYATGKPCSVGHVAPRYTSTGQCAECMKARSREIAAVTRAAKLPTGASSRLFSYRLHPDDHAAALAYCQSLDLQRGRTPQASQAVAAQVPLREATPQEVAVHREDVIRRLAPTNGS